MLYFNPKFCKNETEVESKFIVSYLLPSLGYSPNDWSQEIAFGKIRLDFLVVQANKFNQRIKFKFIIEAKNPGQNLDGHIEQLRNYLTILSIQYGILTNGILTRVYKLDKADLTLILEVAGENITSKIEELRGILGSKRFVIDSSPIPVIPNTEFKHKRGSMKVIAVYHNKGGVGKTTTVINLAAAFSRKGKRVLVIDLDSQANTTYSLGLVKFNDEINDDIKNNYVYHLIKDKDYEISRTVRKSSFTSPGFDVVPSHIDLMQHERELVEIYPAYYRLASKFDDITEDYDIVLIDTPPSLNLYARIALISTDYLIIPSDLKPFANEGLINVINFINEINEGREQMSRGNINVLGVLPSKILTSSKFIQYVLPEMEERVQSRYGLTLFKSRIFERRDLSAAIENTTQVGKYEMPEPKSIFDYKSDSPSSKEFRELANEVIQKIEMN